VSDDKCPWLNVLKIRQSSEFQGFNHYTELHEYFFEYLSYLKKKKSSKTQGKSEKVREKLFSLSLSLLQGKGVPSYCYTGAHGMIAIYSVGQVIANPFSEQ
jgi:hypothetical protein